VTPARTTLAAVACVVAIASSACGGAGATPATPSGPPLHLAPSTDLAQGAELSWIIDVEPRAIVAHAELLPAIDALMSRAQIASLADKNGGIDPLSLAELVVASYASEAPAGQLSQETTLYIARGAIAPEQVEKSFRARAEIVEGRAVDRDDATNAIVRTWGTVRGDRVQVATFGRDAVALEVGRFGPLRVAELFAQERLKRSVPALRVGPLARAAELLRVVAGAAGGGDPNEDPPMRAFALGPFEGITARALGGLLAASTAAAVSARPATIKGRSALACTLVLTGGWGAKADDAAERLRAAYDAFSATGLARLAGLDQPLEPVHVDALPDALRLTVALDPNALARGARAAMGAEISEIMSY
jgi:hypothetical protein